MPLPAKLPLKQQYHTFAAKVHAQRLAFYNRIAALIALGVTFVIGAMYFERTLLPLIALVIWAGFVLFRYALDVSSETNGSNAANKLESVIMNIFSKRFILILSVVWFNFCLISSINHFQPTNSPWVYHEIPTNTIKPFLNGNFTMFLFNSFTFSLVFTVVFVIGERYRLHYKELSFRQEPVEYLKSLPFLEITTSTSIVCLITSVSLPIVFWLIKDVLFNVFMYPIILTLGLNSQQPQKSNSMSTFVSDTFMNIIIYISLTALTYLYNAYATVGCLVVDKPISSYSETPFLTLVNGLNDLEHPLARVTAFQELLFMATTPNIKTREVLYRSGNWAVILDILVFILSNTAKSARSDLPKSVLNRDEKSKDVANQVSIFGNLSAYKNTFDNDDFNFKKDLIDDGDITVVKRGVDPSDLFQKKTILEVNKPNGNGAISDKVTKLINAMENKLNDLVLEYQKKLVDLIKNGSASNHVKIINSLLISIHSLFYGNAKYQAQKRLQNKYIVELSVEALAEIMIHCKGEEQRDVVFLTLTESLILLAKVYKGTSQFIKNYPNSEDNDISELNQLTIKNFYKLVVFYNSSLNDLILPPEVFKLAKWCTDLAVEMEKGEIDWD